MGPVVPGLHPGEPNGALLCIPTAFTSWSGEALDNKIPLLQTRCRAAPSGALGLLGETAQHVYTTVGPEQEYFLIMEQYYLRAP